MFRRVYLDNSATTPIDRRVVDAMIPFLTEKYGNASSIHFFGQEAKAAVDEARHKVADLIKARPAEIVFLSGGTEANNLAIRGLCEAVESHGKHISNRTLSRARSLCCDGKTGLGNHSLACLRRRHSSHRRCLQCSSS
jgi:cysteine sulfinate desulfinase/cysteine desulfurase-like protein